jgi:hypothetical protein
MSVRGFFCPDPDENFSRREMRMKKEQTLLKVSLLLIKDWDGFQVAMRLGPASPVEREKSAGRGNR